MPVDPVAVSTHPGDVRPRQQVLGCVAAHTTVAEAARRLSDAGAGLLVVERDGVIVGVVREAQLIDAAISGPDAPTEQTLQQVLTAGPWPPEPPGAA